MSSPPSFITLETPSDTAQARTWVDEFRHQNISKQLVEFTFSRSSGPGGQNVNKVNTKATLRCPLTSEWIPLWARETLKKSLHALVLSASSSQLVNAPSEEQKERVRKLQSADRARRRLDKAKRSSTKSNRGKGGWD
ncbi:hypothetical protein PHLCEN_2v10004 [Hermanssonia centrifuga]|uniref:Uncharacterized protein n=1 Tax=Hermanssonia centrifuga TaxID=98765 RepID=A0A2R6NP89_9APHY|nr:hypothetical protein PHLCEN_2v10004 [Hermanssonia centrifuga]